MKKIFLSAWVVLSLVTYNTGLAGTGNLPDESAETSVTVLLLDSNGSLLTGGSLRYYDGSWHTVAANGDGSFTVVTSASKLTYEMTYEHAKQTKSDVRVTKKDVIFQTADVSVHLKNSLGEMIDEGNVAYYTHEWHNFGTTNGGMVSKELLPGEYSFRMTYEGSFIDRQKDIVTNTLITFNTEKVTIQLRNNQGAIMDFGSVTYIDSQTATSNFAGSSGMVDSLTVADSLWDEHGHEFGTTLNGEISKELLPNLYYFRMIHENILQVKLVPENSLDFVLFQAGPFGVYNGLMLDKPTDVKIVTTDSIVVSGTKYSFVQGVTIDGRNIYTDPYGSFNTVVVLIEGLNVIEIIGEYLFPNLGVKIKKHLIKDALLPAITITGPSDSTITTQQQITLTGSVSEPVSVFTVNSDTVTVNQDNNFSTTVPLSEGSNDITIRAVDLAGSSSTKVLTVTRDTTAPELQVRVALGDPSDPGTEILQVTDGDTLSIDRPQVYLTGEAYDGLTEVTMAVNQITIPVQKLDSLYTFQKQVTLNEGTNPFEVLAADQAGNTATVQLFITRPADPKPVLTVSYPSGGLITDSSSVHVAGTVSDTAGVASFTINGQPVPVASDGSFAYRASLFPGDNYLVIRAVNEYNYEAVVSRKVTRTYITDLPPDPAAVAPELDSTVVTTMAASTEFLYKGPNPVQYGVEAGTIEARRAGVVKGKVLDASGSPLSGVLITVKEHPEFGYTLTRADGQFDMAVNGGGNLTLNYKKDPYLPVQRQVNVPWQDYAVVDSVIMLQLDPNVTTIDFSGSVEVARGSLMSDADGSRQATMMFEQGTVAKMVLPDGSTQSLSSLNVRATEFTVGENGPAAMPGELPPTSGYTYAAEFSVDEALATGATSVTFDQPVAVYVENFIGFPVGSAVPTGYYDRQKGEWIASENGRVIEVKNISNGLAEVDIDGDGAADPDSVLGALGINSAERGKIAALYAPGQSLWRTEITHFTPWDFNWPYGPPASAKPPQVEQQKPSLKENDKSGKKCGSVISVENQTLGEAMNLTGTPCGLHYNSATTRGSRAEYILPVSLTDSLVPQDVKRIDLKIRVAGTTFDTSFTLQPKLTYNYHWGGKDAYDRFVQGSKIVGVSIGYVYDAQYYEPAEFENSFASTGQQPITANRDVNEITLWQDWRTPLGSLVRTDFGGWHPGIHHQYDLNSGILYQGNGMIRKAEDAANIVRLAINQQFIGYSDSFFSVFVNDVKVGPDGSVYLSVSQDSTSRILRKKTDGTINTVIELPYCQYAQENEECGTITMIDVADDGSIYHYLSGRIYRLNKFGRRELITNAFFWGVEDIAVAEDGSIYVAEDYGEIIKKIGTDGNITTFAGTGEYGFIDDLPRPALQAKFMWIMGMDIGPEGSVFVADSDQRRIRKITPDGIISTVAGTGEAGYSIDELTVPEDRGDGGPATSATLLRPYDLAVGQDGSIYISEFDGHHIRKVTPEGTIFRLAGLFGENPNLRKYSPDNDGGFNFNNGPSTDTRLSKPDRIAVGPDNNVYFTEWTKADEVRMIESKFNYFDGSGIIINSRDGGQIYEFNSSGKHLKTLDALTFNTIFEFGYDPAGLLSSITDIDGLVTTVERDTAGTATAFVAPFGQRTELIMGADGYLSAITNPEGETYQFDYAEGGLLTGVTDPRGNLSSYAYDSLGYFVRADYPNGGVKELSKTETQDGFGVTLTTAEGRTETYQVDETVDGSRSYITTDAHGLQTVRSHGSDGTITVTAPDGTTTFTKQKPDPRFGMQAPLIEELRVSTPSGLESIFSQTRTITQMTGEEVTGLTDSLITNGKVTVSAYDGNQRLTTTTSLEGRQAFTHTDSLGRVIQSSIPGIAPVNYRYNADGFLTQTEQGGRTSNYTYNDQGYLQSVTDPLSRVETTAYDSVGRVTRQILPNGEEILYDYDENGNLASITPPGQPAHTFAYTEVDLTDSYVPPAVPDSAGGISYLYDKDKKLLETVFSDSSSIQMVYDTTFAGSSRPMDIIYDQGTTSFDYDTTTGNLASVISSDSVAINYSYDGSLTTQQLWSGPVTGTIDYTYDNDFRVTSQSINSANTIGFTYDNDGLLVGAGALSMSYDSRNGLLNNTAIDSISSSYSYNSFGELTGKTTAYSGADLYDRSFTRDSLGRITSITETIGGQTDIYEYTYNDIGYLVMVKKNGLITDQYQYDANGNRTAHITPDDTVTASYDDQDRMLTYGNASYTYGKRGELQRKIEGTDTTRYDYDNVGNLRSVVLPDGTLIEYLIDGQDRRVGKKVNGLLVKRWLYTTGLMPVAELDSAGNVDVQYGPGYFVKNDTTYRVLRDQLGSVRMIVNSLTGEVVQKIDYDPYGNIIYVQNDDEFIDIGYAGGLDDKDTGLVRFGARDYDPQTGRWTSKDPILFWGGTSNLYEYALNDPINNVDPDGLQALNAVRDFVGAAVGDFTTIPFTDISISDEVLDLFGEYGYYDRCSEAAKAGEWAGTIGQFAAGGKGLLNLIRNATKGVSVIGPRSTYREFAKTIGANFLDVTDEAWTMRKNVKFLQGLVQRGDDVAFAGKYNPKLLDPKSVLAQEIRYLQRHGYSWNKDFTKLIKR